MRNALITLLKLYLKKDLHRPTSRASKWVNQFLRAYSE